MPEYRVRKSNLLPDSNEPGSHTFARVVSNENGLTLSHVDFDELQVVKHEATGQLGRRATLVIGMKADPTDSDWVICEITDVILPQHKDDLEIGEQSEWKEV